MNIPIFDTSLAAIQLNQLFDIRAIFKRRGRKVVGYESVRNALEFGQLELDKFEAMKSWSFRRIIGFVSNSNRPIEFAEICAEMTDLSHETIASRLEQATKIGMLTQDKEYYNFAERGGFGSTLEWFVAQICYEELASIAYWGVTVEGLEGDYDVVVIRDTQIGYIECKSGKLENIKPKDVQNFLKREGLLSPRFSIFLIDGVSRERLQTLVDYALQIRSEYAYGIPGVMAATVELTPEYYKNFVRLIPINAFFVSVRNSILESLREVYEFQSIVCDRDLRFENRTAKKDFGVIENG